mgnify:FL=1|jgi:hypothetical protein
METKVIPFVPSVTDVNPAGAAATQLQDLINTTISEGWEFVTITSMSTSVKATGCGKSNAPAIKTSIQLLIFKK